MAGLGRFSVGRACAGPDCTGCTDPCPIFTAASFADLTGLTEIGTVAVAGGVATLEVGEGLIVDAVPTNYYDPVILTFTAETADATATIRAMVAAVDASNGLYGEYSIAGGVGTLVVGERVSGTNTPLVDPVTVEDTADLGDETTYTLCWVPGAVQVGGDFSDSAYPTVANSGDGWASPENILLDDGSWASYLLIGAGTTTTLIAGNFPFFVQPGSTIDGIEVGIEARYTDLGGNATLTYLRLQGEAGAVGDDRGTGQAVTEQPASSVIGSGGAADDWSAGLTWEDINSVNFGVQMQFDSDGGAIIEVDYVVITIYYTTPDRQLGRLTFSRNNVTAMTADCAKNYQAEAPGTGKKAIVLAAVGEWDVASIDYSYHQSAAKPSCPACECAGAIQCNCCAEGFPPPAEIVVDFDTGGLTDGCDFCDTLVGEFVLEPISPCWWEYRETVNCDPGGTEVIFEIRIILTLSVPIGGTTCAWGLRVFAMGRDKSTDEVGGDPFLFYASDPIDTDEDCQDFPATLSSTFFNGGPCTGTPPGTITIDIP